MSIEAGHLYIVATPLGNLADITYRAVEVLRSVDVIAAEDTRHSARLLQHYGIGTAMISMHEHNESQRCRQLVDRLQRGESIALIADAGTPLINDPGYRLVSAALASGLTVSPIPGPSAITAALSAAGLPTERFAFEGFLPARPASRRERLAGLALESRTLVFYEAPHRILACLQDMQACFGPGREAAVARELTKRFETIRQAPLETLCQWVAQDTDQQRGEFVVLVSGAPQSVGGDEPDAGARRTFELLMAELPLKQAARLAAELTGERKNVLYELGLRLREKR